MAPNQVRLVQATVPLLVPAAENVAALFYDRLFTLDPALRTLFRGDIKAQGRKLMATLTWIAQDLDRPEQFLTVVRRLGQRHVAYGVQPEDYQQMEQALLWALAQGLGDAFTPEVEEAWAAAYRLIANAMQEAAAEIASRCGLSYQPDGTNK